mgnify:CR=1 FL=1
MQEEQAQRGGDLGKAAEIHYGKIPEKEKDLQALHNQLGAMQSEESFLKEEGV